MTDLRRGDCLELMKAIPDGSIDLVLTDRTGAGRGCAGQTGGNMSGAVAVLVAAAVIVLGGVGLGKVMYERGYVHGYEDAQDVTLTPDGEE